MHETELQEMKKKIDALWNSLTPKQQTMLLKEHDIKADRDENQDPRKNAEDITNFDTEIEHLGDMNRKMIVRMMQAFEEEYDHDTVKNLHAKEKDEYNQRGKQYHLLKKQLAKLNKEEE